MIRNWHLIRRGKRWLIEEYNIIKYNKYILHLEVGALTFNEADNVEVKKAADARDDAFFFKSAANKQRKQPDGRQSYELRPSSAVFKRGRKLEIV